MNEDSWGNLDTREWRDHELIREYLNDAPEENDNKRWTLKWTNSSEMMASGESKRKTTPEILRMGMKRISHEWKQLRRWQPACTTNLQENRQDLRESLLWSSNAENYVENHHEEFVRYSETMMNRKVKPKMKRIWKRTWRRHLTDEIHSYI